MPEGGREVWYHLTRIFSSFVAYIKLSTVPSCRSPPNSPSFASSAILLRRPYLILHVS